MFFNETCTTQPDMSWCCYFSTWEKPICGWSGGVGALNWYYVRRWKKMSKGMMVIWRVESLINWYCIDCIKSPIHNTQIEVHLKMKFIHEWKLPMWLHLQFHNYKRAFLCWERIFYLLIEKTKKKVSISRWFSIMFHFQHCSFWKCLNFNDVPKTVRNTFENET